MLQNTKQKPDVSNCQNRNDKKIVIFYVDPKPDRRKKLANALKQSKYEVTLFENMNECLTALRHNSCRLLLADEKVLRLEGIDLICKSRIIKPHMHILVFYNDLDNYPALKKAAKGGICTVCKKPIKENTIAATIDSTLQNNDNSFHTMKNSLSERELEIIKMVGEGKVNKEIAFSLNISVRTVEFHRSRIMRKLKIDRVANLIKMAFCLGLVDIEYHTPEICPFMQEAYKNS